jgi:F0F1-type ATP synthase assembly protein I
MNHDYQSVTETFAEQEIDKDYIQKALNELGFDEFPKSGLEDSGLSKLVKTATEIYHSEAQLIPRKIKTPKKIKDKLHLEEGTVEILKEISKGAIIFSSGIILGAMGYYIGKKTGYAAAGTCYGAIIGLGASIMILKENERRKQNKSLENKTEQKELSRWKPGTW